MLQRVWLYLKLEKALDQRGHRILLFVILPFRGGFNRAFVFDLKPLALCAGFV